MSKSQPFQINWLAAAGSALGAVSSAVLLSTLGAAGTLFGAAVGSLTITVGGSIYTQSLQRTTARVSSKLGTSSSASEEHSSLKTNGAAATARSSELPKSEPRPPRNSPEQPRDTEEKTSKGLPWKRIIGLSVGVFIVAMAIILAFELSTGRPVSSFTGGTSDTNTGTTFSGLGASSRDSDTPEGEEPGGEATSTEQPGNDEPDQDEPRRDSQFEDNPAQEEPAEDKPVEEKPADPPPAADSEE